jgi:hypothetical protein
MTMFQHAMLGNIIFFFLWIVWLRHYFYTPKNRVDINNEVNYWMNKKYSGNIFKIIALTLFGIIGYLFLRKYILT